MQISPAENHFAILTSVAAPAILTNASSVLCLGVGNRIARVVDRTRAVAEAMAHGDASPELETLLNQELVLLRQRSRFLVFALRLGYTALGAFAGEALVAVLGGLLSLTTYAHVSNMIGFIALAIGALAVAAFVTSCTYMVRETMIALDNLQQEADAVMLHTSRRIRPREVK